ncbi:MAG: hypothetical protein KF873_01780 [Gemmataceae bacterium]|nr:hypothetical protein [Planctomycetia bacterium]MBX3397445.1 hypothetical protein [Gemmataceae bacterium]
MDDFYADVYMLNKNNYPSEELAKLQGKVVAWSLDGKQIVGVGEDHGELFARMRRLGRSDVVYQYIWPEDVEVQPGTDPSSNSATVPSRQFAEVFT